MDEKIEVYEAVRNEIISAQEMQRTVWIYMYVLFCTLVVLGLEWSHYLFLVSYIILIPFQCVINDYRWSISKMSTYIRIFFEDIDSRISWESLHKFDLYKDYYKRKRRSIRGILRISGATHLGFLAMAFFVGYTFVQNDFVLDVKNTFLIIFAVFLFMFLVMINRDYYKDYDKELEEIMKKYKQERRADSNISV